MATTPLIVTGSLFLAIDAATPAYVDVSDEVTAVKLSVSVDSVDIPSTLSTVKGIRGGSVSYAITIDYLSADGTTGKLFDMLLAATNVTTRTLIFKTQLRAGVFSATNPQYVGTMVVSAAEVGGNANELSSGSATFPLTGAWVRS